MAHGGSVPTPTDALFVLNKVENGDRDMAVKGIEPLAVSLGLTLEAAAASIVERTCAKIVKAANTMLERLNRKPVYTIHEIQEGGRLQPQQILILGGPAPYFAEELERQSKMEVGVVPKWSVANAIGAALARTTSEVTFFADTEQGVCVAPGEEFQEKISSGFCREDAVRKAFELLKDKAVKRGANPEHLEMEILEELEFNMVRGFSTIGKNTRIRVQVKPGLITGYQEMLPG